MLSEGDVGGAIREVATAPTGKVRVAILAALVLAAFSYVTAENLPVGLLPQIAAGLHRSLSGAGLLVTFYAATVAITAVPLTLVTRRMPRRILLPALLGVFVVSTALVAAAPNYPFLLGMRIITALTHAIFWSIAASTAASLFPPSAKGRATGAVFGGVALASVLGLPLSTWLGQQLSWRYAFAVIGALGAICLIVVVVALPSTPVQRDRPTTMEFHDNRRYWRVIATTGLVITGTFAAYTYISPFLVHVGGFAPSAVGLLLAVFGCAGVLGTVLAGIFADRDTPRIMVVLMVLQGLAMVGCALVGAAPVLMIGLLAVWGAAQTGLPTVLQTRVLQLRPDGPLGSAIFVAVFNIGIGLGALTGALILPRMGGRTPVLLGGLLILAVAIVGGHGWRHRPRSPRETSVGLPSPEGHKSPI